MKKWRLFTNTGRYDKQRVSRFDIIRQTIQNLNPPYDILRKLNSICNAIEVQIETGGDHPDVNTHLLDALRSAITHQIGQDKGRPALDAINHFAQTEQTRWQQVKSGTLPPIPLDPEDKMNDLIESGYELIRSNQTTDGCDRWLEAWSEVKNLVQPSMRCVNDFDAAYPNTVQFIANWADDFEAELHNAGLSDQRYFVHRAQFAQEFLTTFPETDPDSQVSFKRAEAEALWELGKVKDAELVYQKLVTSFPNKAWGYIGWSDNYYLYIKDHKPKNYERGEEILLQALKNPDLDDPVSVRSRLENLRATRKTEKQNLKTGPSQRRLKKGKKKRRKR